MENWKRIQIEHIHGNELLLNEIVCFYFRNDFVCFLLLKDQGYLAERFTNVALLRRDIRIKQTIIKLAGPNKCIHYCAHIHIIIMIGRELTSILKYILRKLSYQSFLNVSISVQ